MSSHMINLFLCILSSLYLCFGLLYFCCRILPSKHKISLPLFLCLSVFMALLFWIKRESQHNGITIVFQLTTFLVTLFLFQASFMKKLAVYFIFIYESAVVRAGLADEHETESVSRLPSAFSMSEAEVMMCAPSQAYVTLSPS